MFRFTAILCFILLEIEYHWVLTRRCHGGVWEDIFSRLKKKGWCVFWENIHRMKTIMKILISWSPSWKPCVTLNWFFTLIELCFQISKPSSLSCFNRTQFTLYIEKGSLVVKTAVRPIVYFWIYKENIFSHIFQYRKYVKKWHFSGGALFWPVGDCSVQHPLSLPTRLSNVHFYINAKNKQNRNNES